MDTTGNGLASLEESERQRVAKMVAEKGTRGTSAALGIAPATTARLVAGLPVTRGTVALVRSAFTTATPTAG